MAIYKFELEAKKSTELFWKVYNITMILIALLLTILIIQVLK